MDNNHEVNILMERILANQTVSKEGESSACKAAKNTAAVKTNPPNEKLQSIISKYFLSENPGHIPFIQ